MLELLLVRHGQTAWNQERRIMGNLPVPLDATGRRQSQALARFLKKITLNACYTSPAARAVETAKIVMKGRRVPMITAREVLEIDYGEWVGKRFDEVTNQPAYRLYHSTPKKSRPPAGESMLEVRRRCVAFVERLKKRHRKGRVLVVSHADIIKTILTYCLRLDLNDLQRFRIDNGSLTLLWFHDSFCRVLAVNHLTSPDKIFLPVVMPRLYAKKKR